jgi:FkbM family methyltransferase
MALSHARNALRRLRRRALGPSEVPRSFHAMLRALGPGSLAVDCGANVGTLTALFAERGADVIAFEPNPAAYAVLSSRFHDVESVHCRQQAVGTTAGRTRLYLHANARDDGEKWSSGSSVYAGKPNVDPSSFVDVDVIDLGAFIATLGRRVTVLKLDVEGAEIPILEQLAETSRLDEIDHVVVEMHDRKIPELGPRGERLRQTLASPRFAHVRLDWR